MNPPISSPDITPSPEIAIEAENVSVYYGDFLAVRDVSLESPNTA